MDNENKMIAGTTAADVRIELEMKFSYFRTTYALCVYVRK